MKTNPCRYCHGSRQITFTREDGAKLVHECTSCNGTGIDGDPRLLFCFMIVCAALVACAIWYAVAH